MCDLDFNSVNDNDVAILVGADFQKLHLYRDIKIGKDHEPIPIQSTLAWVLLGGKDNNQNFISSNSFASFVSPTLDQIAENFWEVEPYGTNHKENLSTFSKEEQRAIQTLQITVSFDNNHYTMGLLWKNDQPY